MELILWNRCERGASRTVPRVPSHRVTKHAGCRRPRWLPGDCLHEDGRAQLPGDQVALSSWDPEVRVEITWWPTSSS